MARTHDGTYILAQVAFWLAVVGAINWGPFGPRLRAREAGRLPASRGADVRV